MPSDGRAVFLQPYYDKENNTFRMFVPVGNKLTWVFAEPVEACYYAEGAIDESKDIYLKILDLVARHYSFDSVIYTLQGIIRDVLNCSVILERYFVFLERIQKYEECINIQSSHH